MKSKAILFMLMAVFTVGVFKVFPCVMADDSSSCCQKSAHASVMNLEDRCCGEKDLDSVPSFAPTTKNQNATSDDGTAVFFVSLNTQKEAPLSKLILEYRDCFSKTPPYITQSHLLL